MKNTSNKNPATAPRPINTFVRLDLEVSTRKNKRKKQFDL